MMVGCVDQISDSHPSEPIPTNSDASSPPTDWSTYDHQADESKEPIPCEKYERVELRNDAGGIAATVRVPLPCDPLWWLKDRGDPPFKEQ